MVNLPLFAALHRDHVLLYRDMSGDSLHRRGYRRTMHKASLNESAAAGALLLANWPSLALQGNSPLRLPIAGFLLRSTWIQSLQSCVLQVTRVLEFLREAGFAREPD